MDVCLDPASLLSFSYRNMLMPSVMEQASLIVFYSTAIHQLINSEGVIDTLLYYIYIIMLYMTP